jgi:hypothetical protein
VFKADMPGIRNDDLDITLSGHQLHITGKRDQEHEQGEGSSTLRTLVRQLLAVVLAPRVRRPRQHPLRSQARRPDPGRAREAGLVAPPSQDRDRLGLEVIAGPLVRRLDRADAVRTARTGSGDVAQDAYREDPAARRRSVRGRDDRVAEGGNPDLADVYLLTGPNGTGKSTILYALASVIAGKPASAGYDVELGRDLLATRMRSKNAVVALRTDDGQTFAASHPERPWSTPSISHFVTRSLALSCE